MTKIFSEKGKIVRFIHTEEEEIYFKSPISYDNLIEFDETTNANVINELDNDFNSFSVTSKILTKNNIPVVVNPPGEQYLSLLDL